MGKNGAGAKVFFETVAVAPPQSSGGGDAVKIGPLLLLAGTGPLIRALSAWNSDSRGSSQLCTLALSPFSVRSKSRFSGKIPWKCSRLNRACLGEERGREGKNEGGDAVKVKVDDAVAGDGEDVSMAAVVPNLAWRGGMKTRLKGDGEREAVACTVAMLPRGGVGNSAKEVFFCTGPLPNRKLLSIVRYLGNCASYLYIAKRQISRYLIAATALCTQHSISAEYVATRMGRRMSGGNSIHLSFSSWR